MENALVKQYYLIYTLLKVNKDRSEGLKRNVQYTKDLDLKLFFNRCYFQSLEFTTELNTFYNQLGLINVPVKYSSKQIHNGWYKLKGISNIMNEIEHLQNCEFAEKNILHVYDMVLADGDIVLLSKECFNEVVKQRSLIEEVYQKLINKDLVFLNY
ncbi:hypothetical protein C3K47_05985 [Solitalea longa]|uniref:DUF2383 domain-containing protein n=1 Tax=Solitalea longa TaxID=2079460 RepID=A0A2S5A5D5_9SPHI|nr:hypothetical protein [Solitalea longa]POY37313.1 hypothetical protein C3K47_05985 [Solitalea longa]